MIDVQITNEQKIQVVLSPLSAGNKPAKIDGKPTWEIINGLSTIQIADDGLSAFLISSDDPGVTVYLIKADADLGDGVEEISDTITLTVVGARAVNLGLNVGGAVPK